MSDTLDLAVIGEITTLQQAEYIKYLCRNRERVWLHCLDIHRRSCERLRRLYGWPVGSWQVVDIHDTRYEMQMILSVCHDAVLVGFMPDLRDELEKRGVRVVMISDR